jgi:hypothetical protein
MCGGYVITEEDGANFSPPPRTIRVVIGKQMLP